MNPTLRNKLVGAVVGGASAITIAAVMLGNADGLEGRRYYAYQDVVGVWTVCDGHTGADIRRGHRYTDKECDALLQSDLRMVAAAIDPLIKVHIPETTRAALYSFTYNVGAGAFSRSTLLKKLNSGDVPGACKELQRWTYAGGKQWKPVVTRIGFNANQFVLMSGSGDAQYSPFAVVNGQVFMSSAFIQDGTITNAKIGNFIQSNNYVAGQSGWKLDKGGTWENYGSDGEGARKTTNVTDSIRDANGVLRVQIGKLTGVF